jgi:hypothetical protein
MDAAGLEALLKSAGQDLNRSIGALEKQIRENSQSLLDFRAEDVFYQSQGRISAYYLLFKALSHDYKDIIVQHQIYPAWIKMLKAMEDGAGLDPWIIRNEPLNHPFFPNHLNYLAYYSLKALAQMQLMIARLGAAE